MRADGRDGDFGILENAPQKVFVQDLAGCELDRWELTFRFA